MQLCGYKSRSFARKFCFLIIVNPFLFIITTILSETLYFVRMAAESASSPDDLEIYRKLDEYPWDQDKEFQGGLSAILGQNLKPSQIYDLTLQARCFYFSRKTSVPISFDGYKSYLAKVSQNSASIISEEIPYKTTSRPTTTHSQSDFCSLQSSPEKSAPYPPSFAEIIALITSGAPIPGIRDIPPTLVPEQASAAKAQIRKKPWANESSDEQIDSGTFGNQIDEIIEQEYPKTEVDTK